MAPLSAPTVSATETIAVIGAGKLGRALALRAVRAGFLVVLEDLFPATLEAAHAHIRQAFDEVVAQGQLDDAAATAALARIDCVTTIEDAARRAHIVMETGPDEQESKLEMFCLLDRICLPGTTIVSNCHALELTDTAVSASNIVGLQFVDERAEIRCSQFTGPRALAVVQQLAARMATHSEIVSD